jgi:hypothetical protein
MGEEKKIYSHYALFLYTNENVVGPVQPAYDAGGRPLRKTVWYKSRPGAWTHNAGVDFEEIFCNELWDVVKEENPRRGELKVFECVEFDMRVARWPAEILTIHRHNVDTQLVTTKFALLSTHAAITCLLRIQNNQWAVVSYKQDDTFTPHPWAQVICASARKRIGWRRA